MPKRRLANHRSFTPAIPPPPLLSRDPEGVGLRRFITKRRRRRAALRWIPDEIIPAGRELDGLVGDQAPRRRFRETLDKDRSLYCSGALDKLFGRSGSFEKLCSFLRPEIGD